MSAFTSQHDNNAYSMQYRLKSAMRDESKEIVAKLMTRAASGFQTEMLQVFGRVAEELFNGTMLKIERDPSKNVTRIIIEVKE